MNDQDFTDMAHRIGEALCNNLGGRFYVKANFSREQDAGSDRRTLHVVDRWSDQDCTIAITRGVPISTHQPFDPKKG